MERSRITICSALLMGLYGCGGGGGSGSVGGGTGSFSFGVSDNPADAEKVNIAFQQVVLKPTVSGAAPTLIDVTDAFGDPQHLDLLTVTGSQTASLVSSLAVPSGEYQLCIYMLNDETGTDSYVQTAGTTEGLVTNSNGTCGGSLADRTDTGRLFFNKPFTIVSGGHNSLVAEFNLEKGLLPPKGSKSYWTLKPTSVQLVDRDDVGHLEGLVPLSMVTACEDDAGTEFGKKRVYLYSGDATLIAPPGGDEKTGVDFREQGLVDVDEVQPTAAAQLAEVRNDSDLLTAYRYSFGFLEPGSYSAALTCMAQNDDPEDVDLVSDAASFFLVGMTQGATVSSGQVSVLDLE